MKHRSPLITLAAVAVAFAIMFIVNMSVSPPGGSSTGTATPPPAPATAVSSPAPQTSESAAASPSPSPSKSAEESKFPKKIVYAGRTEHDAGAIAVGVASDLFPQQLLADQDWDAIARRARTLIQLVND